VGLTLTANLEFNDVLRQLFESCRQILPMDASMWQFYDEATHIVRHPLFYENESEQEIPARDIVVSPGLSGEVILGRKTIHLPDIHKKEIRRKHHFIHAGGRPSRSYVGALMIVGERWWASSQCRAMNRTHTPRSISACSKRLPTWRVSPSRIAAS